MAEAHSAVAFSFHVTPEGLDVRYNHEALRAVWHSGLHSWKLKFIRFKNHLINTLYPAPPTSLFLICTVVSIAQLYTDMDLSFGLIEKASTFFPDCVHEQCEIISAVLFGLGVWVIYVLVRRYLLRLLLINHSWMYEPFGRISLPNKIWLGLVKFLQGRDPLLYGYQSALPKLPVPSLQGTHDRYLESVRPLLDDEEYKKMSLLAGEFVGGIGKKLQRYLILKSWWATNYVTDWWEQYVYLRGRSPIMVNSNYYGIDAIFHSDSTIQAARAGNIVYAFLDFKEKIAHETEKPLMIMKTVPLCSTQYERMFNLTRIPGEETDSLSLSKGVNYIVVYHKGRYFKLYTHSNGAILAPRSLQYLFQQILNDRSVPCKGEEKLAALTAGERIPWAKARKRFFKTGLNAQSLQTIEKASFVLCLDEEDHCYDPAHPEKLNNFARAMLHGKCYDRWFDKSFNLVVTANGRTSICLFSHRLRLVDSKYLLVPSSNLLINTFPPWMLS
ncbi:CPT1A [Bugula neritina]|uniref:CPT1A n=1 Tax=Bugula neritina TaxID=10212 RepID=A0A7J7IY07_BUGNE|nr:CPT1A [Bugula neritina]